MIWRAALILGVIATGVSDRGSAQPPPAVEQQLLTAPDTPAAATLSALARWGLAGPDLVRVDPLAALDSKALAGRMGAVAQAAREGDPAAQWLAALAVIRSARTPAEHEPAVVWLTKAANRGFAPAQARLGWLLAEGRGARRDIDTAVRWWASAAIQGDASAQVALTLARFRPTAASDDIGPTLEQALRTKAAAQRLPIALQLTRRPAEAAALGDPDAAEVMAVAILRGTTPDAIPRGVAALEAAADAGSLDALLTLKYMYENGRWRPGPPIGPLDVKPDAARARRYADRFLATARTRAAAGDTDLQYKLWYSGVVPDKAERERWLWMAADQGDPEAVVSRAALVVTTGGANCREGIDELERLVAGGDYRAINDYAVILLGDHCGQSDPARGRALLEQAASYGVARQRREAIASLARIERGEERERRRVADAAAAAEQARRVRSKGGGFLGALTMGLQAFTGAMNQHNADLARDREADLAVQRIRAAQLAQAAERQRAINAGGRPPLPSSASVPARVAAEGRANTGATPPVSASQGGRQPVLTLSRSTAAVPTVGTTAARTYYYPEVLAECFTRGPLEPDAGQVVCQYEGGSSTGVGSDAQFFRQIAGVCTPAFKEERGGTSMPLRIYGCGSGANPTWIRGTIASMRNGRLRRTYVCDGVQPSCSRLWTGGP